MMIITFAIATSRSPTLHQVPSRTLDARSLSGSMFNFGAGLALTLAAVVFAFRAVPASQLGPAYPEAAWAFFWSRSTSLVMLFYGECGFWTGDGWAGG